MNFCIKKTVIVLFAVYLQLLGTTLWATDADSDGVPEDTQGWSVSAGWHHTCALADGRVRCWGATDNDYGQTTVPPLTKPSQVTSGASHACALDSAGVHCWGDAFAGKTTVPTLNNPLQVSAGENHTCALDSDGIHCWGSNSVGQSTVPTLDNPSQVSLGNPHTCALDATGVHCWGGNPYGQTTVPVLNNPTQIDSGRQFNCALDAGGVHCWGENEMGQTTVPALENPTQVSAGGNHACAVDADGVHCWADAFDGSYGEPPQPILVNPTQVSAGVYHVCAVDIAGIHCWGQGHQGVAAVPADLVFAPDNCPLAANANQLDSDGDGLGNTCDPLLADGSLLNSLDETVKANKAGSVVAFVGDFNGDSFGDWAIGVPSHDALASPPAKAIKNAGQAKIISGNDGSTLLTMTGTMSGDGFGAAIAGNADVNGDGFADVVVGAPLADDPISPQRKDVGMVRVIFGCKGIGCATSNEVYGATPKTRFGAAVALGYVDSGSKADLVVGIPNASAPQDGKPLKQAGQVVVLSGADISGSPLLTVYGATPNAHSGAAVAAGDFDGVAGAEVIVGAPDDDGIDIMLTDAGSVKIYKYSVSNPIYTQYGEAAKDYFGKALAARADVNKDGVKDVLVGAPGLDVSNDKTKKDVGGAVVLYGSANSAYQRSNPILGTETKSGFGSSVALADVNANGYADLIVSAPKAANSNTLPKATKATGAVTIWQGGAIQPFVELGTTRYGDAKGDAFGTTVSAGDINRDGKADVIVGMPGRDVSVLIAGKVKSQKDAGSVRVVNAASW